MHKSPLVSVLIPSYNYGSYISEAIQSVLDQTITDFELIIIDNCSTDNTEEIVKEFSEKDNRVSFVKNKQNIGMYRNYNQALLLAKGKYIKYLNADDKFAPTLLEKFTLIMEQHSNVSLITSPRQLFGDKSNVLEAKHCGLLKSKEAIFEALTSSTNWIGEPTTVMFRRENINLGLFDPSLLMFADFDMWLRQLQVGDLYIVDEVLSFFRIHGHQGTEYLNNNGDKALFSKVQLMAYKRYALIINKFGYDFTLDKPKETLKYLNKSDKKYYKMTLIKSKYKIKVKALRIRWRPFTSIRYILKKILLNKI